MQTTIIRPKTRFSFNDFKEIWQYRELLYYFTWRDIKVRYKQTFIGISWVVFQPFVSMIVFTVFFGKLANMPSDNIPYPIFVFVGLLFWQFFSSSLGEISNCLISNMNIITKVYFPRVILPISAIFTRFVDFLVASIILVGLMVYYGYIPNLWALFILPVLLLITSVASLGFGLFLASINVKYRDVRYILPFFIQLLMFVTPVIYPSSIAGKYSWLLAINPISGVIKTARSTLLNSYDTNWTQLGISAIACFLMLIVGWLYFRKIEKQSVDII